MLQAPPSRRPLLLGSLVGWCLAAALWAWTRGGHVPGVDRALLWAARDPGDPLLLRGPVWLGEVCRDLTALGSHLAVTAAALVVAGALTLRGAPGLAVRLLATLAGAHALAAVLKASVARPRPELVPRLAEVFTASFPSAHALLPAALYPLLAWLCTREAPAPALRRYAVGVALLLVLLVGTSRVVLGVHYATDVLAGWALGAGWTCALWALAGPARRSG